mmetsp:Transcript_31888/g.75892  ORF Transcript_31888/g.75892 Transcript_31888/m.75892 type:complete len:216 (-) Transcript_31888:132-779(-)|eukprot:CAMPEP_0181437380 /NCGR_PEP_ID=MMETSP1110-20121109/21349_1 /TAXON_ID=174948 /ORGANISM="Symbiodinium sp., Strain CCMP421" /LENGTH=215 /DNA_ID=CAMNT_0023561005 /DNA_START=70 /DNA_END=717 /DNA_ORIENTATION=-
MAVDMQRNWAPQGVASDVPLADLGLRRSISSALGLVAAQVQGLQGTEVRRIKSPLFRTHTVACDGSTWAGGDALRASHPRKSLEPLEAPAQRQAQPLVQKEVLSHGQVPKPRLCLPLQPRSVASSASSWSPIEETTLPPMLLANVSQPADTRKSRQLPARLQRLDDETVLPREVYNRMMQLGDHARGSLGYGQHRKVFTGEGRPVLRREVAIAAH